jgi:oxygen-dependent protoporphyrinogen oxidase
MPQFVRMEREHGSLIIALQQVKRPTADEEKPTIFTSLSAGTAALIHRMKSELLPAWIRLDTPVVTLRREGQSWLVNGEPFDAVIMALPAHVARPLLAPISARLAELLTLDASSAVIAALAFTRSFDLPRGFGFLVPEGEDNALLAGTFVDQKYPERVPDGGRLLRAFFGGPQAARIAAMPDVEVAALALKELEKILGPLPAPAFHIVRRWPRSLPQYEVGHLDRIRELESLVRAQPGLWLIGNAYRGVGIPDLIRDARAAAREFTAA